MKINRRKFFYALAFGASLQTATRIASAGTIDLSTTWNHFAAAARDFTELKNHHTQTVDASEFHAWDLLKREWKKVEKAFDIYYRT